MGCGCSHNPCPQLTCCPYHVVLKHVILVYPGDGIDSGFRKTTQAVEGLGFSEAYGSQLHTASNIASSSFLESKP